MNTIETLEQFLSPAITRQMRSAAAAGFCAFLLLNPSDVLAQDSAVVRRLEKQLVEMQERLEKTQLEQQRQIEALKEQLEGLKQNQTIPSAALPPPAVAPLSPSSAASSSGQPAVRARSGSAYMNMSFSSAVVGGWSSAEKPAEQLELGDHDPQKRGFSLRNAEIALDGAVDPFFKGFASVVLKLDDDDETSIELEESYLQTTSLPGNLQAKAGQFFANFGRQNPQHPHQWAFVDQPLVLNRAFGPDGLRNIGAQVSWLAPTPFYSEVFLGVLDGQGGTAFNFRNSGEDDGTFHGREVTVNELRGLGDLLFTPRAAASFDLTETQTVLAGLSGAFGPNSSERGNRTEIYGADMYWKWKPAKAAAGFPFVSVQSEALYINYEAAEVLDADVLLPAETLQDYGAYSQVLWGFAPRWVTGIRGDYVDGNSSPFDEFDPFRGKRFRLSPALTFYPSEFSKIRLQYNFDEGEFFSDANSIWLQIEFNLGAHPAHKF